MTQNQHTQSVAGAMAPLMPPHGKRSELIKDVTTSRWSEIQKKYPHFPPLLDIHCVRKEAALRLPKVVEDFLASFLIEDKRDAVMLSLIFNICCTTVPLNVYLFLHPSHMLGAFTIAFTLYMFLQRFILMMHYAEHR